MEKKIDSVKNFVAKHRVSIAVGTTLAVTTIAHIAVIKQHNDFLIENDLFEEYYGFEA